MSKASGVIRRAADFSPSFRSSNVIQATRKQAGMIASQCRSGAYLGRYVVVVDDDVDITNSEEFCGRSAAVPTRRSPSIFSGAPGAGPSTRASRATKSATAPAPSSTPRAPTSGAINFPRSAAQAGS